jgi:hypothetical protein
LSAFGLNARSSNPASVGRRILLICRNSGPYT